MKPRRYIAFTALCLILGMAMVFFSGFTVVEPKGSTQASPDFQPIYDMLSQPYEPIDVVEARLTIEKHIDPTIDVESDLKTINQIVDGVKKVPRYSDTVEGKLNGIIQYLYIAGEWNNHHPYQYDFDDPLGTTKPENSLLSNYLNTRKGNCVSMPYLVLALGQRLGLDVSLATAPLHLLVKLEHNGQSFNIESTAGGLKADQSYVSEFGISQTALKNGLYLRNLNQKETIAVMLTELANQKAKPASKNTDFDQALELTSLMLELDSKNISAILIRGNIWHGILQRDLALFKAKKVEMTPEFKQHFDRLLAQNLHWYDKAEALGWQEPPEDYDKRYLDMVSEARKRYE